jgi:hypothetical protein
VALDDDMIVIKQNKANNKYDFSHSIYYFLY